MLQIEQQSANNQSTNSKIHNGLTLLSLHLSNLSVFTGSVRSCLIYSSATNQGCSLGLNVSVKRCIFPTSQSRLGEMWECLSLVSD